MRENGLIKKFVVSYPKWAGTPRYFSQLPLLPVIKHGVRRRNRTAKTNPRRRVAKNSR